MPSGRSKSRTSTERRSEALFTPTNSGCFHGWCLESVRLRDGFVPARLWSPLSIPAQQLSQSTKRRPLQTDQVRGFHTDAKRVALQFPCLVEDLRKALGPPDRTTKLIFTISTWDKLGIIAYEGTVGSRSVLSRSTSKSRTTNTARMPPSMVLSNTAGEARSQVDKRGLDRRRLGARQHYLPLLLRRARRTLCHRGLRARSAQRHLDRQVATAVATVARRWTQKITPSTAFHRLAAVATSISLDSRGRER